MQRITVFLKKKEKDTKKKLPPRSPQEEEMEEELEYPPFQPINLQKNVFDSKSLNETSGINTAPSVFDRQCLFHVKKHP